MKPRLQRQVGWFKPALAGLMAGLVLLLAVVASSESLHHHLHGSSADGQSPCAICSLIRGQIETPASTSPEATATLFFAWTFARVEAAMPHLVEVSGASSRGPPASFSSL